MCPCGYSSGSTKPSRRNAYLDDWSSVSTDDSSLSSDYWSDESLFDSSSNRDSPTSDEGEHDSSPAPLISPPHSHQVANSASTLVSSPARHRSTPLSFPTTHPLPPQPKQEGPLLGPHLRTSTARRIEVNTTRRVVGQPEAAGVIPSSRLFRGPSLPSRAKNRLSAPPPHRTMKRQISDESFFPHALSTRYSTAPSDISFFQRGGDSVPAQRAAAAVIRPIVTHVHHASQEVVDRLNSSHRRTVSASNAVTTVRDAPSSSHATSPRRPKERTPIIPRRMRNISNSLGNAAGIVIKGVRKMTSRTNVREEPLGHY